MRAIKQAPIERHKGNGQPRIDGDFWMRTSSLAKVLEDQGGLIFWRGKMAAKGIASDEELRLRASVMDLDDRGWREVVDRACERAGASDGADRGTSIHATTEAWDLTGVEPDVPEELLADARAYREAVAELGLSPVAGEMFVANQEVRSGGSFDRLMVDDSGWACLLDIKTTKASKDAATACRFSGLSWGIQLSTYSRAVPYDGELGFRDWSELDLPVPDLKRGIVAVIPRGTGTCELVEVDLEQGWRAARLAAEVRDARRWKVAAPMSLETTNKEEAA
jgi:hypothetical protein